MALKSLIISIKHLGDVVTSTVLIPMLKGRFPGMEIHYLVNPGAAPLVEPHPEVARVFRAPRSSGWRSLLSLVRGLRAERYEYAFDLSEGDRSAFLSLASGARVRAGYFTDRKYFARNLITRVKAPSWKYLPRRAVTECHADLARAVGCADPLAPMASLGVSPGGAAEAAAFLSLHNPAGDPYSVCHFTARDPIRLWPAEHCADAARFLRRRLGPVFLAASGADGDMPFVERVAELSGGAAVPAADMSLSGFMALVSGARGVLGLDSLVVHMAGAYGVPAVTLFGPSREANWLPKGPWVRAAHMDLPCRSCVTGGCLGGGVSRCLKEMDFETFVRPHLEELLESAPPRGAASPAPAA
ncbi:MAG: glycosyltransferase family 9 protein [Deltaproteobacteria bacterium]|jgi:ADP-heptose:LPS heptosyltransferase|nr:glycosyltransferase family 9 protein [Deltaproteobacteria bacterium]